MGVASESSLPLFFFLLFASVSMPSTLNSSASPTTPGLWILTLATPSMLYANRSSGQARPRFRSWQFSWNKRSNDISQAVMKGFRPESVPIYETPVREFAVFDRWFSSIPGPTQPNRLFMYSATSHGSTGHVKKQLALGYPQKIIFDSLHENKMDFGIYFQNIPGTLFYRNLRKLRYVSKLHHYDLKFQRDARNGKLPSLTVIEPRYFDLKGMPANKDHSSHDVASGQRLVGEVYETLRAGPQWNNTLFIVKVR